MSTSIKRWVFCGVVCLLILGLSRAAVYKFREQQQAFQKGCQEQLAKLGLTRDAAKAKYPTPEIKLVSAACLLPGASGEVVVNGKFPPGSKFVFENDNIEVVKETQTPTQYRATVKAAPAIGPQTAGLIVITPVSCITAQHQAAVRVGGRHVWTMEAENGWKIVASPRGGGAEPCSENQSQPYIVAFHRKGESAPFETRDAELYFSLWEKTNYRFSVSRTDSQSRSEMEDFQNLMKRMTDPKLAPAEREQIMAKLQKAQQAMVAKMTDQAALKARQEKELQFGCDRIELEYPGGGSFTGRLACAEKVGRRIALTGTVAIVK